MFCAVFGFGKLLEVAKFLIRLLLVCCVFVLENFYFLEIFIVGKFCQYGKVDYLCRGFVLKSFTSTQINFFGQH